MKFNYNKLKGKITEVCGSQREFAEKINLSERSLTLKLSGKVEWKQSEIIKALEILNLGLGELLILFFDVEEGTCDIEIVINEDGTKIMNKGCINSLIEKECNYISEMIDRGAYSVKEITEITNALAALVTASASKNQIIYPTPQSIIDEINKQTKESGVSPLLI